MKNILSIFFLTFVSLTALAQPSGPALRSTNGVGAGTTFYGNLTNNATQYQRGSMIFGPSNQPQLTIDGALGNIDAGNGDFLHWDGSFQLNAGGFRTLFPSGFYFAYPVTVDTSMTVNQGQTNNGLVRFNDAMVRPLTSSPNIDFTTPGNRFTTNQTFTSTLLSAQQANIDYYTVVVINSSTNNAITNNLPISFKGIGPSNGLVSSIVIPASTRYELHLKSDGDTNWESLEFGANNAALVKLANGDASGLIGVKEAGRTPSSQIGNFLTDWYSEKTGLYSISGGQDTNNMIGSSMAFIGNTMAIYYGSYDAGATGRIFKAFGNVLNGFTFGGIALDIGSAGQWDSANVSAGRIFQDSGTNYLYYFGGTNHGFETPPTSIGVATSTDGTNFTRYSGNPILTPGPGAYDAQQLFTFCVIKKGAIYYGFYNAADNVDGTETVNMATAPSPLGPWTKYSGNPVFKGIQGGGARSIASDPAVFALRYGGYGMIIWNREGVLNNDQLMSAVSVDLTNWTNPTYLTNNGARIQGYGPSFIDDNGPEFMAQNQAGSAVNLYRPVPPPDLIYGWRTNLFTGSNYFSGAGYYTGSNGFSGPINLAGAQFRQGFASTSLSKVRWSLPQALLSRSADWTATPEAAGAWQVTFQVITNTAVTNITYTPGFNFFLINSNAPESTLIIPASSTEWVEWRTDSQTNISAYVMHTDFNTTNLSVTGLTLNGTTTNAGLYWVGGVINTNFSSGNWRIFSNAVETMGTTNNSTPKITIDGTLGVQTNSGKLEISSGATLIQLTNGSGGFGVAASTTPGSLNITNSITSTNAAQANTRLLLNGAQTGASGMVIDYTTNNTSKFSVDTAGFMTANKIYGKASGGVDSLGDGILEVSPTTTGPGNHVGVTIWSTWYLTWGANTAWIQSPSTGNLRMGTNVTVLGTITATNGVATVVMTASNNIPSTGWTNNLSPARNAQARLSGSATTVTVKNASGTAIDSYSLTGIATETLESGMAVTFTGGTSTGGTYR